MYAFVFVPLFVCWLLDSSSSLVSSLPLADTVSGLAASSAMLSPVVQTVLQMGFETGLVESLVQTKYLLTGQQYTSVSDLVSDVLQAEQEDRERAPQSPGKSQCGAYFQYFKCSSEICLHRVFVNIYSTTPEMGNYYAGT